MKPRYRLMGGLWISHARLRGECIAWQRRFRGWTQAHLAEIGGVTKRTQIDYEKGRRNPDAAYLAAIARFGFDIDLIVTGRSARNDAETAREMAA